MSSVGTSTPIAPASGRPTTSGGARAALCARVTCSGRFGGRSGMPSRLPGGVVRSPGASARYV
eukprot:3105268-Alexandrium_andersonii.AAC.1